MDKRTALIVIDMQRAYLEPESPLCIPGAAETVPACTRLIQACRERDIPVVFVMREYRDDGSDVEHPRLKAWLEAGCPVSASAQGVLSAALPEEFGFKAGDYLVKKPRFSAFFGTELDMLLHRLGVDSLLMAGTTTPNCIRTTAYDAIALEYNVAVAADCTSSATAEIQRINLEDMARIGVQLISSEDFIGGKVQIYDSLGEARKILGK